MVRKTKRRKRIAYNAEHVRCLLSGWGIPSAAGRFYPEGRSPHGLDLDALRQAWVDDGLREQLLGEYIQQHPGKRPYAWWLFDAPEKVRRIISGYNRDLAPEDDRPGWAKRVAFGRYSCSGPKEWDDPPVYESQAADLDRHGLLTEAEREALGWNYEREEVSAYY